MLTFLDPTDYRTFSCETLSAEEIRGWITDTVPVAMTLADWR
jgi:hypothetical protein